MPRKESEGSTYILVIICCLITIGFLFAANQTWIPEQPVRVAEAEAEKLKYEAELTQIRRDIELAKADLEIAKGQRAVLESAARANDNNVKLVSYYAHRSDYRIILLVVAYLVYQKINNTTLSTNTN
jgi:hypothetical protein